MQGGNSSGKRGMPMQVQLWFSARQLRSKDYFSKSDPFLKLYMQKTLMGNIQPIDQTETIRNTYDPDWKKSIKVDFSFQIKQHIGIEIYDDDGGQQKFQFLGKGQTTLGDIMGSKNLSYTIQVKSNHGDVVGSVTIRAQKCVEPTRILMMKWRGKKLANVEGMGFFNKSDPFLKFLKVRLDNTAVEIARTDVQKNNLQPNWQPVQIPLDRLVDMNQPFAQFKVQCWDSQSNEQNNKFIGQCYVKIQQLKNATGPLEFVLSNIKIKQAGFLLLQNQKLITSQPSQQVNLVDYFQSGLQFNLAVAIDFTASNGVFNSHQSLHSINNPPNQYQKVLYEIWSILEKYDSDKKIAAFGFGAKPKFPDFTQSTVSHCFPLTGNINNLQISGFDNLMKAYVNAQHYLQLSGPTHFYQIIEKAFQVSQKFKGSYYYQILLILTDGEIHDMDKTKDLICKYCNLPLSIIIVGIGNADFGKMNALDGDNGLFNSSKQRCPRDIVQFVPFNKFQGNTALLAQQILRQVPNQTTQYMNMMGIKPQYQAPQQNYQEGPGMEKPPIDIFQLLK